jgi:TolA-binding protein
MDGITRTDLRVFGEELKDYIRERDEAADSRNVERFRGINDRLDRLNGSVARHERELGEQSTKIKNLEREVFERQRRAARATDTGMISLFEKADEKPAITKGDVRKLIVVVGIIGTFVEAAHRIGEFAFHALKGLK